MYIAKERNKGIAK